MLLCALLRHSPCELLVDVDGHCGPNQDAIFKADIHLNIQTLFRGEGKDRQARVVINGGICVVLIKGLCDV